MNWFDKISARATADLAGRTSRRSLLASLGGVIAGSILLPLLPVNRTFAQEATEGDVGADASQDPKGCDYWAYCSVDGYLCSCCGGTANQCPPGSTPAPLAWTGTCLNPGDGKSYVVAYHDCCGTVPCQRCFCNRNEGDTPRYLPQRANSVNWCGNGGVSVVYNCTTSRVLAIAD